MKADPKSSINNSDKELHKIAEMGRKEKEKLVTIVPKLN